jgi:hypothetical protein
MSIPTELDYINRAASSHRIALLHRYVENRHLRSGDIGLRQLISHGCAEPDL